MSVESDMHVAYIESMRTVASVLPDAVPVRLGDWFVYDAGVGNPEFNVAAVAGRAEGAAGTIDEVEDWFTARGVGWRWKLRPGADDFAIRALGSRAQEAFRREPYLWRPVDALSMPAAPDLEIERVAGTAALEAYDSFDADRGRPPEWSIAAAVMALPSCSLWLGWVDGKVAARVMALASRPMGTIANVIVAEKYRRRGFGRAITAAAIRACADGGSTAVCLGSSTMGYQLYLGMGFEHRYDLATFIPTSTTES